MSGSRPGASGVCASAHRSAQRRMVRVLTAFLLSACCASADITVDSFDSTSASWPISSSDTNSQTLSELDVASGTLFGSRSISLGMQTGQNGVDRISASIRDGAAIFQATSGSTGFMNISDGYSKVGPFADLSGLQSARVSFASPSVGVFTATLTFQSTTGQLVAAAITVPAGSLSVEVEKSEFSLVGTSFRYDQVYETHCVFESETPGAFLAIDEISVVPEPSGYALMIGGAIFVHILCRRRMCSGEAVS